MALRNRYTLNCQVVNWARVGEYTPVGYHIVAPGETVQGEISVNVFSKTTISPILTRMYLDAYVFYVPFRLLWDEWPEYIAHYDRGGTSKALPQVTDLFQQNFEKWLSVPAAAPTANLAFQRRAYNLTWNSYFSSNQWNLFELGQIDQASMLPVFFRASTFDKAAIDHDTQRLTGSALDTSGPTLNTETIRQAFSQDNWKQTRAFYGDRYTDYLRALGVEGAWTILEDPECIGQHHTDWKYRMIAAQQGDPSEVGQIPLGGNAGYFNSTVKVNVKRTFCPEHGFIAAYICTKGDSVYTNNLQYPWLAYNANEQFWSPEYEALKVRQQNARTFTGTGTGTWITPTFQEYRMGMNMNPDTAAGVVGFAFENTGASTPIGMNQTVPGNWDTGFNVNSQTFPFSGHFQATAQHRLTKISPVVRAGTTVPLR